MTKRSHFFTYLGFTTATVGPRTSSFRGIYDVTADVLPGMLLTHGFKFQSESNNGMYLTYSNEQTGERVQVEMYQA